MHDSTESILSDWRIVSSSFLIRDLGSQRDLTGPIMRLYTFPMNRGRVVFLTVSSIDSGK